MARPLRIEYPGAFYHVTARGNERKRIYFTKRDYLKFREYIEDAQEKYGCLLHVYVFMTNHYHMIIETPNPNISKVMHFINGSYTTYINKKRDRSGHLFQGRYKAILIDRDNYLLEASRYIHLNPVRARIVEKPEEFLNSSYASYIPCSGLKAEKVMITTTWQLLFCDYKHWSAHFCGSMATCGSESLSNRALVLFGSLAAFLNM